MNNRRISGAIFYLASAILSAAWYLAKAIVGASGAEQEQMDPVTEHFLPVMSLICMSMGVLELLQSESESE